MNNTPQILNAADLREWRLRLEKFTKALNAEPNPAEVKTNPAANNTRYIPISYLQTSLDELFFGLWQTSDLKWERMGNEIVGTLTLEVFHPAANIWIKRTGAAATQIRLQKGANPLELDKKFTNSFEMDFPHLAADCLRNACASLGKSFGRDLNRREVDQYKPILHQLNAQNGQLTVAAAKEMDLDKARMAYDNAMQRARMDDDAERRMIVEYQNCETPSDIYRLAQYIEREYIPTNDPRQQNAQRAKN